MIRRWAEILGLVPPRTLSLDIVDEEFIRQLYNWVTECRHNSKWHDLVYRKIWTEVCGGFVTDTPNDSYWDDAIFEFLRARKGFEIYEFLHDFVNSIHLWWNVDYRKQANRLLERNNAPYRFVDWFLTPITNDTDIGSIEDTLAMSTAKELFGVKSHISRALELMTAPKDRNYRNSMHESISAVESVVKRITGDECGTLADALKDIDPRMDFHPAFKKSLSQLYGYTSDGGIRHSMKEGKEFYLEDARFMLVTCSAFVNYLIIKAERAEVKLGDTS